MKIVTISDIHYSKYLANKVLKLQGDMLIVAGDLTNLGNIDELFDILDIIQASNFSYKIVVYGNHEVFCQGYYPKEKYKDIIFLDNEIKTIGKLKIYGSPYCKKFLKWGNSYTTLEEQIEKTIPKEDVDIIVCHEPPSHPNLSFAYGVDIGNNELRKYLERENNKTKLLITGHCHECGGIDLVINNTRCINTARTIMEINIDEICC